MTWTPLHAERSMSPMATTDISSPSGILSFLILTFSRSGSSRSMMLLVTAWLSLMAQLANSRAFAIWGHSRSWLTMTYLLSGEM